MVPQNPQTKRNDVPVRAMKAQGTLEVQFHSFLTSLLERTEWSALRPGNFSPSKEPPVSKKAR